MSSEMREVDQLGFALQRLLTPKQWEQGAITDRLNAIRALLARTEAGADGGMERPKGRCLWFPVNVFGGPMREYAPGKWENAIWPSDAKPDTHPQDASGDAELLKDLKSRIADIREMLMSRGIGDQRIYGCDEWSAPTVNLASAISLIDAAMQAKEAK